MDNNNRKVIVVSAVNLRKGGTLTILKDCLQYLSSELTQQYRIVALVHKKDLCDYPGIEYVEMPYIINGWGKRLWCEYVTMHRISQQLAPVYLWLSLHDTSPRVIADRQAVYCQTSFPFFKWHWHDFKMDFKIPLFAMFTRFAYQINVRSNKYLIVQQQWLRDGFSKMLGIDSRKFIVAPPQKKSFSITAEKIKTDFYTFFFASTSDCHKNFETLCKASRLLENEVGTDKFRVVMTVGGQENKYAKWLFAHWGHVKSLDFAGFMSKERLYGYYQTADCLVFPSRVETWGLPISEFMETGKPMLLADLPYAHETAAGSQKTAFFSPEDANALKECMKRLLEGDESELGRAEKQTLKEPQTDSWKGLFDLLLE